MHYRKQHDYSLIDKTLTLEETSISNFFLAVIFFKPYTHKSKKKKLNKQTKKKHYIKGTAMKYLF